jgi:hypothetical protein
MRAASAVLRGLSVASLRTAPCALHPLARIANAAHAECSDRLLGRRSPVRGLRLSHRPRRHPRQDQVHRCRRSALRRRQNRCLSTPTSHIRADSSRKATSVASPARTHQRRCIFTTIRMVPNRRMQTPRQHHTDIHKGNQAAHEFVTGKAASEFDKPSLIRKMIRPRCPQVSRTPTTVAAPPHRPELPQSASPAGTDRNNRR